MDGMNGYDIFDEDDAYFNNVRHFWPKMLGLKMLGVQNQGMTGTCTAQVLVALMYTHTGDYDVDMGFHVKCSVKQLYDVFSARSSNKTCFDGFSMEEAIDYIEYHGLFRDSVYPWTNGNKADMFTMPALPVEIFRSSFTLIAVNEFEEQLEKSPLAGFFFTTDGYLNWVEEGSRGIFRYEIEEELSLLTKDHTIEGHAITIVGVGGTGNNTYFLCQDSWGSEVPNCGYKKISWDVFQYARGCYVKGIETHMLISEDDEYYKALASFKPTK